MSCASSSTSMMSSMSPAEIGGRRVEDAGRLETLAKLEVSAVNLVRGRASRHAEQRKVVPFLDQGEPRLDLRAQRLGVYGSKLTGVGARRLRPLGPRAVDRTSTPSCTSAYTIAREIQFAGATRTPRRASCSWRAPATPARPPGAHTPRAAPSADLPRGGTRRLRASRARCRPTPSAAPPR